MLFMAQSSSSVGTLRELDTMKIVFSQPWRAMRSRVVTTEKMKSHDPSGVERKNSWNIWILAV